ncbi:hypothetical protein, partial [Longimicrobium sp.]|uniref:hypothetical protein n=1 Tax=Longimicrobium sp. TaxID=2029185 RepID=UPI002E2EFDB6
MTDARPAAEARMMADGRGGTLPRWMAAPSPALAFALAAAVHAGYALLTGAAFGGDSEGYSQAADRLIASGFDYAGVVGQTQSTYPAAMYVLFATVVALLKLVFGGAWAAALVGLNVLAAAGTAALAVSVARRATDSALAAWGALALFTASFPVTRWTPFILSDTTFLFLAFLVFAAAADRVLHRDKGWAPVFALAAVAAFYRPTGAVLLPAAAWALYLARSRPGRGRRIVTGLVAGAGVAGVLVFSWIMQRPARWPLGALTGTVERTARFYRVGEVVSGREPTFHAPPSTVADYAAITADRFIHFFAVGASDFSLAHTLVNAAFFVPAYLLAAWLFVAMLRGRDGLTQPRRDVFLAAAGFVLATAAFHALLQVDFDWRYRLPVLPHLMVLAAGGI